VKYFIETYGCQMNVADSELVMTILNSNGFEVAADISEADVILFNTCSVRQHAEDRVIGRIIMRRSINLTGM
jgi:tRNA-2-methylthio-N6-dimethylallyladenosine synthase